MWKAYLALVLLAGTIKLRTWFKDGTAEATIQGNPSKDATAVVTARAYIWCINVLRNNLSNRNITAYDFDDEASDDAIKKSVMLCILYTRA